MMEVDFTTYRSVPSYVPEDVYDSDEALPAFPDPPSYTRGNQTARRRRQLRHSPRSEHTFTFRDTREHAWAILRVQSSATSPTHQPVYRPGDEICGFVDLDLTKEKTIQAVNASVRGRVCFSSDGDITASTSSSNGDTFLDMRTTLWKPSMGDPRTSSSPSSESSNPPPRTHNRSRSVSPKEYKEKMSGRYSFPFMFTLPNIIAPNNGQEQHDLPPTLYDTTCPVAVIYEITITVQTALFKSDALIRTLISVVPSNRPPLPSPSRELIYTCQSNIPPPGPREDPEGWSVSKPTTFSGTLFGSKVNVGCTLALANPVCYTRGYTIPLQLFLSCNSKGSPVLDMISSLSSLRICLLRTATYKSKGISRKTTHCVAMGICWPNTREYPAEGQKFISCEIKLKKSLTPSFTFQGLKLEYSVALMPFQAVGLSTSHRDPLLSIPVGIVASRASTSFKPISCIPEGCREPPLMTGCETSDDDPTTLLATMRYAPYRG